MIVLNCAHYSDSEKQATQRVSEILRSLSDTFALAADDATRTIYLHDRLNARQKRCTLLHELIHAHYHNGPRTGPYGAREEQRTRRLTASKLISMPEYRLAEQIYDGDVYRMACELDVTVQVLRDYQAMLAERPAAAVMAEQVQ